MEKFPHDSSVKVLWYTLTALLAAIGLYIAKSYHYLLFHTLVELFSIAIAFVILILVWNTHWDTSNRYLKILGLGYAAAAGIDLIHTLAFKGMQLFSGYDANLPTQLWIAARSVQALTLLVAPLAGKRRLSLPLLSAGYGAVSLLLVWSAFSGRFPDCFLEGKGLTDFKIYAEYLIVTVIAIATYLLYRIRDSFSSGTYRMIMASYLLTIVAELAFTTYFSVYGLSNMIGHYLKVIAYFLLYRAIFVTAIQDPLGTLFKELKQSEQSLIEAKNSVEQQVTERTAALQESEEQVRSQEIRLKSILEGTHVGTWEWNVQTGETMFNERWAEIIGYTLAELEPVSIKTWMKFAHPDDLKQSAELLESHFAGELEFYECEARMLHRDGHWVWVHDRGRVASWSDDGKPLLMAGTHQDITRRKELEQSLIEAKEAADAANQAKSEFLANMSHEIRTPMNGVIGMTQLLRFTKLTTEQQEYLDSIELSSESLLQIINDVLDLSKIESGKIELEYAEFSLRKAIEDITTIQISRIYSKQLTLQKDIPVDLPEVVRGDQLRIKQILLNLLSNAVKFTEQGSVTIAVRLLEQDMHRALIRLTVSDTGIGIPPEALQKIFKPFEQADTSTTRRFGGTGLGLTICRKLAELMGGTIAVESSPGAGSSFHLEIPFELSATAASRKVQATNLPERPARPLSILIAEDNQMNQRMLELLLQKIGHNAICTNNGKEAFERWRKGGVDLILMDIQMPVMTGLEALEAIRAEEKIQGGHLPVIALTADALKGTEEMLLKAGFDGYLTKPVRTQKLVDELVRMTAG